MRRVFFFPVCVCLILLASVNVNAQLTVDSDLGSLSLGTTAVSGDTATGSNQVDYYFGDDPTINFGNENIFQFSVTQTVIFNVSSVGITGNPDFFLLDGLTIGTDSAGKDFGQDTLASFFLDNPPPQEGFPFVITPGTYYLAASSFLGFGGAITPGDATYDIQITLEAAPSAPPAIDLGEIASADVPFTIDTFGSSVADTELTLWDENGNPIITNDDADFFGGITQSELDLFVGLPEGTYFLAVGGFNSIFNVGFFANSASVQTGPYVLNYNGSTTSGTLGPAAIDFYSFNVGSDVLLGDCNLDGVVDFFDITPFISALASPTFLPQADCNEDGMISFFDIQPFIQILSEQE